MEFRLLYQGPLASNGKPAEKHAIREQLHPQLRNLWNHIPLDSYRSYLTYPAAAEGLSIIRPLGGFKFAPLVCSSLRMYAEIDILMLRPGELGGLITQGGDIDNRLKTLFDALRYPLNQNEVPNGAAPTKDQDPFFCLLEDDQLINKVSVTVDKLLVPAAANEVHLVMFIKVKGLIALHGNLGLIV
jgi:hypothetical protein